MTDEPINNIDGVIARTTYGYYDKIISALAMHRSGCSRTKIWNVNIISYLWMQTEIQKIIWQNSTERNFTITRAIRSAAEKQNSKGYIGEKCYFEIDTEPGVSVDAVDKMAMYLQLFSKFNETAGD